MNESRTEHFGKQVLAGLVILIAALIVLKLVVSIVASVFVPIIAILAVVALIWAARVLL